VPEHCHLLYHARRRKATQHYAILLYSEFPITAPLASIQSKSLSPLSPTQVEEEKVEVFQQDGAQPHLQLCSERKVSSRLVAKC